jgi:hypothetical protein
MAKEHKGWDRLRITLASANNWNTGSLLAPREFIIRRVRVPTSETVALRIHLTDVSAAPNLIELEYDFTEGGIDSAEEIYVQLRELNEWSQKTGTLYVSVYVQGSASVEVILDIQVL